MTAMLTDHDDAPEEYADYAYRCRRGLQCADRVRIEIGSGFTAWAGATLAEDGLCRTCTSQVTSAISQLPGDCTELSELLVPTGERRLRDPDLPTVHSKPTSQTPFRDDVYALIELIDFETSALANDAARETGMTQTRQFHLPGGGSFGPLEWSTDAAARSRRDARVRNACLLIRHRMADVLALPVMESRARSKTTRRADGHDPDTTTRWGDDYWTNRDGIDRALLLMRLHKDAERHTGRDNADLLPLACPKCRRMTLVRAYSAKRVDCRVCEHGMSDQEYDAHFYQTGLLHGLDQPPRKTEPRMSETLTPAGVVRVRPLWLTVQALTITPENLAEARDWCGGTLHENTEVTPPRRWIRIPGVVRLCEPGDVLIKHPAIGRNPAQFEVTGAAEYRQRFAGPGA